MAIVRYIVFVSTLLLSFAITLVAQPGFYVPANGKIFFKSDTATIFSNVLNYGSFGIGKTAQVNFAAKTWMNDSLSVITDELHTIQNPGGVVCFMADTIKQQIDGAYSFANRIGPAFPTIVVKNKTGIELVNSTTKIRTALIFSEGLFYLNDKILMMGEGHPASIAGYDSLRYVVTNYQQTNGFLLRENITSDDSLVVFPVGSKEGAYTPAAIRSNEARGDDYFVGVSDSVKTSLFSGTDMHDTSVNKTWKIGKVYYPDLDNVEIYLQHLVADEGSIFSPGRSQSFVSKYTDTGWDVGNPQTLPVDGYITTGSTLFGSGVNNRNFNDEVAYTSYFTKFAITLPDTTPINLILSGSRLNNDITTPNWQTNGDAHVVTFTLQRRLEFEPDYTDITTIYPPLSSKLKGTTNNYGYIDTNSYEGLSYYRLKASKKDTIVISNIVIIPGSTNFLPEIWPNPNEGHFFINLNGNQTIASISIWGLSGQTVLKQDVNTNIVEVDLTQPGTYFVGFITTDNKIIATRKVIVQQ